ncbi:hypothetical protein BD410DRAFT_809192 [Rickenella mellea]|uniref:Uncharacterized protein n=1 Tax=Rickenella mellea TaxID=50990 RepID=A0A4Y7PHZ8_9AGAM|nr:hypothetical protein BD410DRAFT_809192 [Rickenella mellea]
MSGSMLVQIFVAICLHPLTTANAVEDFSNLPVSQPWREVMDSIHTTNDIDVLPAYDINNVIPPVEHAVRLPGATVEPHLALICFFIASKGESGIVAEICKTNVLIPPGFCPRIAFSDPVLCVFPSPTCATSKGTAGNSSYSSCGNIAYLQVYLKL